MLTPAGVRAVVWWLPGKDLSVQSSCQAGFYGLMLLINMMSDGLLRPATNHQVLFLRWSTVSRLQLG